MAVNAISKDNLDNYRDVGTGDFNPGVEYAYDAVNAEIDVTDASTFPSGVSLLRINVRVFDKFGGEVRGSIENPDGSDSPAQRFETIDVSTLDRSKPLDITATVIGDGQGLVADGGAYNIGEAGKLGSWDKQSNSL